MPLCLKGRDGIHTDRVLISRKFIFFGRNAPDVPAIILDDLGYENRIGHRVYPLSDGGTLLTWLENECQGEFGRVLGDPFQFRMSGARYSAGSDRVENVTVEPLDLLGIK